MGVNVAMVFITDIPLASFWTLLLPHRAVYLTTMPPTGTRTAWNKKNMKLQNSASWNDRWTNFWTVTRSFPKSLVCAWMNAISAFFSIRNSQFPLPRFRRTKNNNNQNSRIIFSSLPSAYGKNIKVISLASYKNTSSPSFILNHSLQSRKNYSMICIESRHTTTGIGIHLFSEEMWWARQTRTKSYFIRHSPQLHWAVCSTGPLKNNTATHIPQGFSFVIHWISNRN